MIYIIPKLKEAIHFYIKKSFLPGQLVCMASGCKTARAHGSAALLYRDKRSILTPFSNQKNSHIIYDFTTSAPQKISNLTKDHYINGYI